METRPIKGLEPINIGPFPGIENAARVDEDVPCHSRALSRGTIDSIDSPHPRFLIPFGPRYLGIHLDRIVQVIFCGNGLEILAYLFSRCKAADIKL
jgi:hypothetical protein